MRWRSGTVRTVMVVLEYYSLFGSDYVEFHLYRRSREKNPKISFNIRSHFLECMDCEMSASSGQPQSAYKSRQTEHMVSVEMCVGICGAYG